MASQGQHRIPIFDNSLRGAAIRLALATLPVILVISVVFTIGSAQASTISQRPEHFKSLSGSSPDNWLGGTGNWSNGADWSAGLPGTGSDVVIYSGGNDTVTLDTSPTINSLTLGGANNGTSSELTDNGAAQILSITGALTVGQTGYLYLTGGTTITAGASSINFGTMDLEGPTSASTININGDFNNSGTIYAGQNLNSYGSLTITGTLTNGGTMQLGSYNFPVGGGGGGATVGGLVNNGTINLTFGGIEVTGNATNSGGINIDWGSGLGVNGNLLNAGGIATFPNDNTSGDSISVAGTLTNTGSITIEGSASRASLGALVNRGGIVLSSDFDSYVYMTVTGDVMNSGTITLGGEDGGNAESIQVGGTMTNSPGAQFNMTRINEYASIGNLINGGSISLESDMGTLAVSGTLTNNLGGSLVTSNGRVRVTAAALTNNGSIDVGGEGSILQVNGNASNSGQLTTSRNGYCCNTISISGSLANNVGGTFSLDGGGDVANVGYISNAGTISIASGAALNATGGAHVGENALPGFLNSGIVNISQGATLASPLSYVQTGGQTTVDGTLRTSTRGVINFAGGSVYGNGSTIQGTVISNAAINIGDSLMTVGQLSFLGNYTQGANGSLTFDIAGSAAGQYDQLNISGHSQLNGLMTVDLINGFIPQLGNTFDIMNFSGESGMFSTVTGLPINNQEHFVLEYNSTDLMLDVVQGQLSGANLGSGVWGASAAADNNGASLISSAIEPQDKLTSSTPEPGTFLLLGSGLLCLGYGLRRRMTK